MALISGSRLGPYEILAQLGAGGMGEVYRARDTRLDRIVAIKVLAAHLSASPELKQRFEREARTISALNHPHICQLFDVGTQDGTDYLVMECLEGEVLFDRIRKGALPLDELLKIGTQIAEALQVAHRAGIIHRDLKPGNIMLTKSGAKLMDFGLAKTAAMGAAASGSAPLLSAARTVSGPSPLSPLTTAGSIVGTIQYMSPEQIEGKEADARSDIFAFGAVLYEMATGKRAFEGKSQISVASAILEKDPEPMSASKPLTPVYLEHVVRRALAKDPEDRWQTASDVRGELQWIAQGPISVPLPPQPAAQRPQSLWKLVAAFSAVALIAAAVLLYQSSRTKGPTGAMRSYLPAPPGTNFIISNDDTSGPAVISRDGTQLAFVATDAKGARQVWVRSLSDSSARPLQGTDNATYPFWSPDGKTLGFFSNSQLKTVPAAGGPVITLAGADRGRGGSWGEDGLILYSPGIMTGIFSIPSSGGTAKEIVRPVSGVHTTYRWPVWLPGGKYFLYLASNHLDPQASERNGIYVSSLDGKTTRMLIPAESNAVVAPNHLLYVQNGVLMALPFDARSAQVKGDPEPIAQGVERNPGTWRGAFDVSDNGMLVYQEGASVASSLLFWYTPGGKPPVPFGEAGPYFELRLSPDGKKMVIATGDPSRELWVYDLSKGTRTRLTFGDIVNASTAAWSPDGERIAFSAINGPKHEIYLKNSSGSGGQELLVPSSSDLTQRFVTDWSRDGKNLTFTEISSAGLSSMWIVPMTGDRKPKQFAPEGSRGMSGGRFSPDGKWMAYVSAESGKQEVYVTSFPNGSGKWQISVAGGNEPRWRRDSGAIIYRAPEGTLLEVPLNIRSGSVDIGTARQYVKATPIAGLFGNNWDLAPDGRAIVNSRQDTETSTIDLISNWQATLKK